MRNKDEPDVPNTTVSCTVCQKTFAKSWNLKRHQQDAHGLTEKGNTVQNSAGIAVFTTEALVKETVIEKILAEAIRKMQTPNAAGTFEQPSFAIKSCPYIAFLRYVFMCPFKQLQINKQNNTDCT